MDVVLPILEWVLPVVSAVLAIVLVALAKKYIGKLGIERSERIDDMLDNYVGMGVRAAERAALAAIKAQQGNMTGESKKAHAVKVVLAELEQSGIKGVAEDLIAARIEAYLEDTDPKASTGEPDSTTA